MARNTNPGNALAGFSCKLNGVVIKPAWQATAGEGGQALSTAALYAKTVVHNPERKLAVAITLMIEEGKVYSTLTSDFMKNIGDMKKILQIPAARAL